MAKKVHPTVGDSSKGSRSKQSQNDSKSRAVLLLERTKKLAIRQTEGDSDTSSSIHSYRPLAANRDSMYNNNSEVGVDYDEDNSANEEEEQEIEGLINQHGKNHKQFMLARKRKKVKDKIIREVLAQIMPDFGDYTNERGYSGTNQREELSYFRKEIIRIGKFLGFVTLDLHEAVLTGSVDQLKKSIKKISDPENPSPELINSYNAEGHTPLSLAVKVNNLDMVGLLLQNEAIPDLIDESTGRTPLYYAVLNGSARTTNALLKSGANPNMVDFQCVTPLMVAAARNNSAICHMLCGSYADVDLQDDEGWTALHHAAGNDSAEAIAYLLAEGADRDRKDHNGRKPLHIAKYRQNSDCIALLSTKSTIAL